MSYAILASLLSESNQSSTAHITYETITNKSIQSERPRTLISKVTTSYQYLISHVSRRLTFSPEPSPPEKEIFSSWALLIHVGLLIIALSTSYYLQLKKIQAVHETVISIIAGTFL